MRSRPFLVLTPILLLAAALLTAAVPSADHVRLKCVASRMNVNDYSIRKQVRVDVTVTSSDAARLERIEDSRLTVVSPDGVSGRVAPYKVKLGGGRFKAHHADVIFKLVEDSASRRASNVPRGFFRGQGPYRVRVDMRWESYRGKVSFGEPVALKLSQAGVRVERFVLSDAAELEVATLPESFGPVYYKRPDVTNFMYQLANMDAALQSGDFHPEVESPQWFLQVRTGLIGSEPTELLDPSAYIPGAQGHMIRNDGCQSPLRLPAGTFAPGQTVLIDFSRSDTAEPNSVFASTNRNFSDQVAVQERVVYSLEVRDAAAGAAAPPAAPDAAALHLLDELGGE